MNPVIWNKTYETLPFNKREILRYASCKEADETLIALLESCLEEVRDKLTYKVCYGTFPVTIEGAFCDFGAFQIRSESLAKNLAGCREAVLFAATVGVELDRLIARYSRIAPSKALLFQAIGAERVEALCDAFCQELGATKPRFSPGYGDLPLAVQSQLFAVLDCGRRIGLTLNDSLLMSPSKSVTAFVGKNEV